MRLKCTAGPPLNYSAHMFLQRSLVFSTLYQFQTLENKTWGRPQRGVLSAPVLIGSSQPYHEDQTRNMTR